MSVKHFEDLWEKSEKIAEKYYDNLNPGHNTFDIKGVIGEIQENLIYLNLAVKNNDTDGHKYIIGKILFNMTFLSKKLNVNTYAVLKDLIEDIKIDMLELDNNDT